MNLAEPLATPFRLARGLTFRDPGDISDLTVWLEADRGAVLDSSGNVSEWRDQSGRGNHAAQGTAAARPTYGALNGRPVVQTTKAARFLSIPSSVDLDPSSRGFTVYIAFQTSSAFGGAYLTGRWASGGPGTPNQSWIIGVNDSTTTTPGVYMSEVGTLAQIRVAGSPDASTGAPVVVALRYNPDTGLLYCRSGATESAGAAIAGPTVGTQPTCIGRLFSGDVSLGMDADVFAFMAFRRSLTTAEDVAIRDYLARRWGVA